MPAQVLLELSGSWEDEDSRGEDEILSEIKNARIISARFNEGFDVFT